MAASAGGGIRRLLPQPLRRLLSRRLDPTGYAARTDAANRPSFDLIRAAVNLMVASGVVSYATSLATHAAVSAGNFAAIFRGFELPPLPEGIDGNVVDVQTHKGRMIAVTADRARAFALPGRAALERSARLYLGLLERRDELAAHLAGLD